MLNSKKILFILPDVTYSAELLPDKKPLSFSIQTCVQINGTFIENREFNVTNLSKLFAKLDSDEEYQLVLPDELFTNTILLIKETGDAKIKEELKDNILPSLSLLQDTHDILTTVLNELRGTTRVQLSAVEKELLVPLRAAAHDAKIKIERIAPLSWTVKSIVSLEPSVVILQLGAHLYGSLHYIGVEQCFTFPADKVEAVVEKIQALKKDESSIMTCYLVTNALVESGLKSGLKQILPIQQMTEAVKDQEKLPAAVATIIEESARTMSIPDFPVPQFMIGKATEEEVKKYAPALAVAAAAAKGDAMSQATQDETKKDEKKAEAQLPKPHVLPTGTAVKADDADEATEKVVSLDENEQESAVKEKTDKQEEKIAVVAATTAATAVAASTHAAEAKTAVPMTINADSTTAKTEPAIDLRQFAGAQSTTTATTEAVKPEPIKNKSRSMTKMIIITLLVFVGTIALGIGVGMLVLKNMSSTPETTPVVEIQASPTPAATAEPTEDATSSAATSSATPSASPKASPNTSTGATASATITKQKILVTNATEKAGYAGTVKDSLTKAGFTSVTAANAKGTYTATGDLIYQKKADAAALAAIEKATELNLTSDDAAKQEDPQGSYDVVIVLNQ